MQQVQRWWLRYGLQLVLVCIGIYAALWFRQEHTMVISEIYAFLSRPFQSTISNQEYRQDARLRELQFRITELENQNERYRNVLGVTPLPKTPGLWAAVIGRGGDAWWQQILIGKGKSDGVRAGDVVESYGGLVGRVTDVSDHSSRVLLISDPGSQIGVVISRSRTMGILRGQNQNLGQVQFFTRDPDVKAGDIVFTSSLSSLFPAGIPVGKVRSVDIDRQPAPEAKVELSAPLALLELVRIYSINSNAD